MKRTPASPPTPYAPDTMRASTELGSPSLALNVEVPRSSSLPGSGTPLWDSMSLPSSPSLRARVPDFTMDLNRWSKRGFSEDLALPPRQIEKPFRFLDLPAEIRNMVYEMTITRPRSSPCRYWECNCRWNCYRYRNDGCYVYMRLMRRQCWLPPIASVNKCLRVEYMSLYYATTDFTWYWIPMKVLCEAGDFPLGQSVKFLARFLDLATTNGLQIRSITVCSPFECQCPTYDFKEVADSVRLLAPLRRSLSKTGRVHPGIREFKFEDESLFARRLFDFSGSLRQSVLRHHKSLSRDLRIFLNADPKGWDMLMFIKEVEAQNWWSDILDRRVKKEEMRVQNTAKGLERWTGVLRSRPAEV
ncbi:hypothetical protein E4T49_06613 [Aureobasidium sp. EXF-10728]|nr:hypothetical protein E4T49_06613 [Aureobasidium sp. EXF-10728]